MKRRGAVRCVERRNVKTRSTATDREQKQQTGACASQCFYQQDTQTRSGLIGVSNEGQVYRSVCCCGSSTVGGRDLTRVSQTDGTWLFALLFPAQLLAPASGVSESACKNAKEIYCRVSSTSSQTTGQREPRGLLSIGGSHYRPALCSSSTAARLNSTTQLRLFGLQWSRRLR